MQGFIDQSIEQLSSVLHHIYDFFREELPNFLYYVSTPVSELYPDFATWLPDSSMLMLLFNTAVGIFIIRPILHLVTDFVAE